MTAASLRDVAAARSGGDVPARPPLLRAGDRLHARADRRASSSSRASRAIVAEARGRLVGFAIGYLRRPALGGVLTLDVDSRTSPAAASAARSSRSCSPVSSAPARRPCALEVDVRNAVGDRVLPLLRVPQGRPDSGLLRRGEGRLRDGARHFGSGREIGHCERADPRRDVIRVAVSGSSPGRTSGSPARRSRRRSGRTGRR